MSENTATRDEVPADDLYRYVDGDGRKRATAQGSREHLEHLRLLAALEKSNLEVAELEAVPAAPVELTENAAAKALGSVGAVPAGNVAKSAEAKASPTKADPKA